MNIRAIGVALLVLAGGLLIPGIATGQRSGTMPAVFEGVGLTEKLGEKVPADIAFVDESGRPVTIGSYFQSDKPVLLNLVYHDCPMLCNLLLDGMTKSLRELDWTPGEQFEVVTVSFSALEGPDLAARQKERYVELLGRSEATDGWHFLTGSEESIQQLARSVGFEFKWVEEQQQYAHPAALIFLGSDGKITRYLYGLEFRSGDVRKALLEASEGTIGNTLDRVVLFCFQYDPGANSYVPHALNIMKLGGLLTMLLLGAMLAIFWRREGAKARKSTPESILEEVNI